MFTTAKDKTVKVVTNPTFQKVAAGVVAAVGAGVAGVGAHSMMKDRKNKQHVSEMEREIQHNEMLDKYGRENLSMD